MASTERAEPSIEIEVTDGTGLGVPEPATPERAAPTSQAPVPGAGDERENTAQGYTLATSGLSSSQAPSREPVTPAPRRRRTLLWLSVAAVATIAAGAAGFVLLPAFRSVVRRLLPETQLSALGVAIRDIPGRLLDRFGSDHPSRDSAPSAPATRGASSVLAKPAAAESRPSADEAASATPSAGPPPAAPFGVGAPGALAQDPNAPVSHPESAEEPPATPDPHGHPQENSAPSVTPDQQPLAIPEGVNQELVMQRVRAVMLRAEKCHPFGHAIGTARVTVTFEPAGTVSQATIEGEPVASAPVGRCVLAHARSIIVPRFDGPPFQVTETVDLR